MKEFVYILQKEIKVRLQKNEAKETDMLKKSLENSRVLGEAFDRLKEFIINYRFADEAEEILFFKEIKPKIFCHLIYYRKVYNIEMNRPVASLDAQRVYLKNKLDAIQEYNNKILDFYRYYRSCADYLDAAYFVRGKPWKRSTTSVIRSFRPTAISRSPVSWPTTCCRLTYFQNWKNWTIVSITFLPGPSRRLN